MAENPLLDLVQDVMINKYKLEEQDYAIFKFSEGNNAVTVGMTDGHIPITVSFPKSFLALEEVKRMSEVDKVKFFRKLEIAGKDIPEELFEEFDKIAHLMSEENAEIGDGELKLIVHDGEGNSVEIKAEEVTEYKDGEVVNTTTVDKPKASKGNKKQKLVLSKKKK
jgi:hypothetical protein